MITISMPLRLAKIALLLMALVAVVPAYSQTWSASGANLYYNGGSVGIGTSTPSYLLDVHGNVHTTSAFIVDAQAVGAIGGWFRGSSTGSGNIVLQGNAGGASAYWISGSSILKIGGNGGSEPAAGAINITNVGAVGIGTATPGNIVDIETNTQLDGLKLGYNSSGMVRLHPNSLYGGAYNSIVQNGDAGIIFGTTGTVPPSFGYVIAPWSPNIGGLRMTSAGNVLIGKGTQANTSYMLDVAGNARANEVVVNTTGADFVFDSAYHLPDLSAVAAYIKTNHHLPQIRSAAEMEKDGLNLGDDQTRLLQKIEELTLYIIDQNKRLEELKLQNQRLADRNLTLENLEQRIQRLESLEQPKTSDKH
jgi:hypothetical protein